MRILFLGSGAFAVPTLRRLANSQHEVPLTVTQPARPSGRGRRSTPTPVREEAEALGLEVLEVPNVNDGDVLARFESLDAQLGLTAAFGQKLGAELLGMFPGGCINLHASLLPKYRGAAPINWAILRGEERTGCTVFRMVERMDAGPILTTRWTSIKPEETAGELHDRLAGVGVDAVMAALELFDNGAIPVGTAQDESAATAASKMSKALGYVHFDRPAAEVVRHIRGVTPWPGATAEFRQADGRSERITLMRARRAENPAKPEHGPGVIDEHLYVAASDGFVEILEIRPSGSRTMTWQDFVNGRHVKPGDRLTPPEG